MRYLFIILISFTYLVKAQNWSQNFSDTNAINNPDWYGDKSSFIISNHKLQLNAIAQSNTKRISRRSSAIEQANWSFTTTMEFNPSSSNYQRIYLFSNDSLIDSASLKIYLNLGKTNDGVQLLITNNGETEELTGSSNSVFINSVNTFFWDIKYNLGLWTINYSSDSISWTTIPNGYYVIEQPNKAFAWEIKYSSTRSDKSFLDNISVSGNIFQDTISPIIDSVHILNDRSLTCYFSEKIDTNTLLPANIKLGNIQPSSLIKYEDSLFCEFNNAEYNTNYLLQINTIKDEYGNTIIPFEKNIQWQRLSPLDLHFTEILFKIKEPYYLPFEAIEIYNPSDFSIDLDDFLLQIGSKTYKLSSYSLETNSYLAVFPNSAEGKIPKEINHLILDKDFSLPDSYGELKFISKNGVELHWLEYHNDWIKDSFKKQGNWSVELKDLNKVCQISGVWESSIHSKGNTLGFPNGETLELNDGIDSDPYFISHFDSIFQVVFPTYLPEIKYMQTDKFNFPIGFHNIVRIKPNILEFYLSGSSEKNTEYILEWNSDNCTENGSLPIVFTSLPKENDLIFNEFLFDVSEGETEFIELKNTSKKYFQSKDLLLKADSNIEDKYYSLGIRNELIKPESFIVLSKNSRKLIDKFGQGDDKSIWIESSSFPTLNNTSDKLFLYTTELKLIHSDCYHSDWHHYSVEDKKDISLEKLNYSTESCTRSNWLSAQKSERATPGRENSQFKEKPWSDLEFMESFHPELDGVDDLWQFSVSWEGSENLITARIYDLEGIEKKVFFSDEVFSVKTKIIWDGLDDNGQPLKKGTYIFYLENYSEDFVLKKALTIR
jgi:hypothetical protein